MFAWFLKQCGILAFPFAQAVCRASDFNYTPVSIGFPGFAKWWNDILLHPTNRLKNLQGETIAFLCWHIWKAQNNFIFSGMVDTPSQVWLKAESAATKFAKAEEQASKVNGQQHLYPSSWTAPIPDHVKINCDASLCHDTMSTSVAAILRNSEGQIIGGNASMVNARSVEVAEALAIRLGLDIAAKAGLNHIMVESDNLNLINRIVSKDQSFWETAALEEDILDLSSSFSSCSFSFIPRCCNRAADWVAKNFRSSGCPTDWPTNVPPELRILL